MSVVVLTPETTAADLAETLTLLCREAKAMSRRGLVGTCSDEYQLQHERIDSVLDEWVAKAHA